MSLIVTAVRAIVVVTALSACAAPSLRPDRFVPMPDNPAPAYPEMLRDSGLAGIVVVEMRVDPTGVVDTSSLTVLSETHPAFTAEVRRVIPLWRFQRKSGDSSGAVVQQRFTFRLTLPTAWQCRALLAREPTLGDSTQELRVLHARLPAGRGRGGAVTTVAEFVVDTAGRPDVATLRIVQSSLAARDARGDLERVLYEWRFAPASKGGCLYASKTRHEFVY
jgi:TonB family protein